MLQKYGVHNLDGSEYEETKPKVTNKMKIHIKFIKLFSIAIHYIVHAEYRNLTDNHFLF